MGLKIVSVLVSTGILIVAASVPVMAQSHGHRTAGARSADHQGGHAKESNGDRGQSGKGWKGRIQGDAGASGGALRGGGWPQGSPAPGGADHGRDAVPSGNGQPQRVTTAVAGLVTNLSAGAVTVSGASYSLSATAAVYQGGRAVSPGAAALPAFGVVRLDASAEATAVLLAEPSATPKGLSRFFQHQDKEGFKNPDQLFGFGKKRGDRQDSRDHSGQGVGEVSGVIAAVYGQSLVIGAESVDVGANTAIRYRSYRLTLPSVPVGVSASALVAPSRPARLIRLWQDPNLPPERTTVGAVYVNGTTIQVGSYTLLLASKARVIGRDRAESLSAIVPGTKARVYLNGSGKVQRIRVAGPDRKRTKRDR